MSKYILLTRLSPDSVKGPKSYRELSAMVSKKVKAECPEVKWISNYSVMGPYDYLDVFEAPDNEAAAKVALIIRSFGHASTETWPAVEWEEFEQITRSAA